MSGKLSESDVKEIINLYLSGKYTCVDIGKIYQVSRVSISNVLKKFGIKVETDQSALQRKYQLDENYFDNIDTQEKAYFLGLLYADGYNNENNYFIRLSLQEEDKYILERFNAELKSNRPIGFNNLNSKNEKWKNQCYLDIQSKKLSKRLKELGCFQKKSLTLKFPSKKQVSAKFVRHFIRGFFDGDGSVGHYLTKQGVDDYWFSICGTKEFCESLNKIFTKIGSNSLIRSNNKIEIIYIKGRLQIERVLNYIYKNESICLSRKKNIYNKIIEKGLSVYA